MSKTAKAAHAALTQCIIKTTESAAALDAFLREKGAKGPEISSKTRNQDLDDKGGKERYTTVGESMPIRTKSQLRLALDFFQGSLFNPRASLVAQMVKNLPCDVGDPGLIPGSGRSPGEGNGYPLQYSCPENSMDRGAWWASIHGVAKSRTQLSNQHTHIHLIPGSPR